jgi:NDP-sugar pyrophosphorylase family protein
MSKAVRNIKKLVNPNNDVALTVIIPSAGEGTRMRSFGPKSLIKLPNKLTIIDYQIQLILSKFPNANIIVVHGYEATKVMNYTSSLKVINIENERYATTNVVRSIAIGLRAALTDKILIIYGDLLCSASMLKLPDEHISSLYIDGSSTMTDNEVGCIIHNNYIESLMYDLPNKWAQIVYLTGRELDICKKLAYNINNENLLGFEILNEIINQGGKFACIQPKNSWANDIDCAKDLLIIKDKL